MTTTTRTITARIRSLGYASTSQVERDPRGGARIVDPSDSPDVVGSLRAIEAERARAQRIYSGGTSWREALFVGGVCVATQHDDIGAILAALRHDGQARVTLPAGDE